MKESISLSRLILNLSNTIIQNRNRHLADIDLTSSQADCLRFYMENDGATIKDFKIHNNITHQTAQGIVTRLIAKGFLSAEQSETDKRFQRIHVTEAGVKLSAILTSNGSRTAELLVTGMTEEEKRLFITLLNRAYENVKNDGKEETKE